MACRRGCRFHVRLAVLAALILAAQPCLGQAQQGSAANTTAASTAPEANSPPPSEYNHKYLTPLDYRDVLLFIVVGVALFIASGAGVGGGVLLVPALLIISQFNSVVAVALSNIAILSSAVANMIFNVPRRSPYRAGPLIDYDLVMLLGPPTVVGSIAGSYVNMVIPSWITKITLFLLILPMTWRMVQKAHIMYRKETAARRKAAAEEAAAGTPIAAAALDGPSSPAQAPLGTAPAAMAAPATAFSGSSTTLGPCDSRTGLLPTVLSGLPRTSSGDAHHDGLHHREVHHEDSHTHHQYLTRLSSRPLSRLSATLSSMGHSAFGDEYGPDLAGLSDWGDQPASNAAATAPATAEHGISAAAAAVTPARSGCQALPEGVDGVVVKGDVEEGCSAPADVPGQHPNGTHVGVHPAELSNAAAGGVGAAAQQTGSEPDCMLCCWQKPRGPENPSPSSPELCARLKSSIHQEEAVQLPWLQSSLLVSTLAAVAATNISGGFLLTCGSWQWWLLMLSPLPFMFIVWGVARQHVLWKGAWKSFLGMKEAGDLKWDPRTTIFYPGMCISAGIIAGMLGLGGGLVLTPMMLELGVQPAVSVASTQVTLLISSSTSAIVYAVADSVPWDYGVVLIVLAFIATLLGQSVVTWLVRKLKRNSIIVIILAVMFSAATAAALAVVFMTIIDVVHHPAKLTARKSVCPTFSRRLA